MTIKTVIAAISMPKARMRVVDMGEGADSDDGRHCRDAPTNTTKGDRPRGSAASVAGLVAAAGGVAA